MVQLVNMTHDLAKALQASGTAEPTLSQDGIALIRPLEGEKSTLAIQEYRNSGRPIITNVAEDAREDSPAAFVNVDNTKLIFYIDNTDTICLVANDGDNWEKLSLGDVIEDLELDCASSLAAVVCSNGVYVYYQLSNSEIGSFVWRGPEQGDIYVSPDLEVIATPGSPLSGVEKDDKVHLFYIDNNSSICFTIVDVESGDNTVYSDYFPNGDMSKDPPIKMIVSYDGNHDYFVAAVLTESHIMLMVGGHEGGEVQILGSVEDGKFVPETDAQCARESCVPIVIVVKPKPLLWRSKLFPRPIPNFFSAKIIHTTRESRSRHPKNGSRRPKSPLEEFSDHETHKHKKRERKGRPHQQLKSKDSHSGKYVPAPYRPPMAEYNMYPQPMMVYDQHGRPTPAFNQYGLPIPDYRLPTQNMWGPSRVRRPMTEYQEPLTRGPHERSAQLMFLQNSQEPPMSAHMNEPPMPMRKLSKNARHNSDPHMSDSAKAGQPQFEQRRETRAPMQSSPKGPQATPNRGPLQGQADCGQPFRRGKMRDEPPRTPENQTTRGHHKQPEHGTGLAEDAQPSHFEEEHESGYTEPQWSANATSKDPRNVRQDPKAHITINTPMRGSHGRGTQNFVQTPDEYKDDAQRENGRQQGLIETPVNDNFDDAVEKMEYSEDERDEDEYDDASLPYAPEGNAPRGKPQRSYTRESVPQINEPYRNDQRPRGPTANDPRGNGDYGHQRNYSQNGNRQSHTAQRREYEEQSQQPRMFGNQQPHHMRYKSNSNVSGSLRSSSVSIAETLLDHELLRDHIPYKSEDVFIARQITYMDPHSPQKQAFQQRNQWQSQHNWSFNNQQPYVDDDEDDYYHGGQGY